MFIGYARVSTIDQNLELQRDALVAAHCDLIFTDKTSGVITDRPGLAKALAVMKPGDTLVIWKLSRLGRSLKQLIETVQDLADRGIDLKSLHESIDTSTAIGKLLFFIIAAFAQFERDNMIENTLAGLAAARARGRRGGRRPVMDEKKQAQLHAMLLASPALSVNRISNSLGISPTTYYRYMRSRKQEIPNETAMGGQGDDAHPEENTQGQPSNCVIDQKTISKGKAALRTENTT